MPLLTFSSQLLLLLRTGNRVHAWRKQAANCNGWREGWTLWERPGIFVSHERAFLRVPDGFWFFLWSRVTMPMAIVLYSPRSCVSGPINLEALSLWVFFSQLYRWIFSKAITSIYLQWEFQTHHLFKASRLEKSRSSFRSAVYSYQMLFTKTGQSLITRNYFWARIIQNCTPVKRFLLTFFESKFLHLKQEYHSKFNVFVAFPLENNLTIETVRVKKQNITAMLVAQLRIKIRFWAPKSAHLLCRSHTVHI